MALPTSRYRTGATNGGRDDEGMRHRCRVRQERSSSAPVRRERLSRRGWPRRARTSCSWRLDRTTGPLGGWRLAGAAARPDADAGRGGLLGVHLRLSARHARDALATGARDGRLLLPQRLRGHLGHRSDYDAWAVANPGWSAAEVEPLFARSMPASASIPRLVRS
jgi:hypothetical protein